MHIHLRCGQSNTGCGVHGFRHVLHQFAQALIKTLYRGSPGIQAWIRVAKYRQLGHKYLLNEWFNRKI
jgi:hypothetical protein